MRISVGVAQCVAPSELNEASELLSQADRALYMAKATGRNRVCSLVAQGPLS